MKIERSGSVYGKTYKFTLDIEVETLNDEEKLILSENIEDIIYKLL